MRMFYYKAVDRDGEMVQGEMEAADEAAVVRYLQDQGYLPLSAGPLERRRRGWLPFPLRRGEKSISQKEVGHLTRELATLLQAGLPLDRALSSLLELSDEPRMLHLLQHLQDQVRGGAAFSAALESQGRTFSKLYINLVRAGEAGGSLEQVLEQLADYQERVRELRESILSALIYPSILFTVAALSVVMLLVFVVPQFTQMFADMGKALPFATQVVIGAGDLLRAYWWVLFGAAIGAVGVVQKMLEDPERRYRWDGWMLRLPLFGDLIAKVEVARFSHTLSTLIGNGVPLLTALGIVRDVIGNRVLAAGVTQASESLKQGKGLTEPLSETGVFPKMALQMMKVGEDSGQLEPMLGKVAITYDREVKTAIQRMLSLVEPVLIVGLGVIVAGIIMSILLAVLSLNDLGV